MSSDPTVEPDLFDPHAASFIEDPYPQYRRMRREAPVHYVDVPHKSYWVFTHQLVSEVIRDKENFLKNPEVREPAGNISDVANHLPNGLFFMDPPRHAEVRPVLDSLFKDAIANARKEARDAAYEAVNEVRIRGSFNFYEDFAKRVTRQVFARIFGVPRLHEQGGVGRWVDAALAANDKAAPMPVLANGFTSRLALGAYFQALARSCTPGARSMMCLMKQVAEQHPGNPKGVMSTEEVQQTAVHFALGGYLSATFLLTTGIYQLLLHPDQLRYLRANLDDDEVVRCAMEEMLRFEAPFQLTDRYTARELELGGVTLPKDSKVTMVFGSANRDPAVFGSPDAERFDIRRAPGHHFALGDGIHKCIGKPLLDMMVPAALRVLLAELPNLRLDTADPLWQKDPYFRSFSVLPLRA